MRTTVLTAVCAGIAAVLPTAAPAATAEEVLAEALASYEEQMENIEDVTITSVVTEAGEETPKRAETKYKQKATVDEREVYLSRSEWSEDGSTTYVRIYDGKNLWEWSVGDEPSKREVDYDPSAVISEEILERLEAEHVGTETLDGHAVEVLQITNMLDLMDVPAGERKMVESVEATAWIGSEDPVMRQMRLEISGPMGQMKSVTSYEDYRSESGMLVPYVTITRGSTEPSEKMMEMMEARLQQVPEAQREAARTQMMAEMGKEDVETTKVVSVEVNTGLPDDLFDGNALGTQ
ncbi:MAG: hypothetical protein GF400_02805 [Candidatus Eisenbacteria bacterium]|nr:hypothetical protein [Candidatus Eisenbacteria bacterium]